MPAGRPRTISLPIKQMIEMGEEMVEWVQENDPVHLSEWYCIEKGYTDDEWDTIKTRTEFFPYYKKALKIVGLKYLKRDTDIEPSLKHRWQRVYFKDLKDEEDEEKRSLIDYEYSKKLKSDIPPLSESIDKDNKIMELTALVEQLQAAVEASKR